MKIIPFIILLSSSIALAQDGGGDHQGNGGEAKYSDQFHFVLRHVSKSYGKKYAFQSIVDEGLSIRPTDEDLRTQEGTPVDALSFLERDTHVTQLQKFKWDAMNCRGKYYVTTHEMMVHLKKEKSTEYGKTEPLINDMENRGLITCKGMPKGYSHVVQSSVVFERRGCPVNLIKGIQRAAQSLQNTSLELVSLGDTRYRDPNLAQTLKVKISTLLIQSSAEALTMANLARLCIDFMNTDRATPVVRKMVQNRDLNNLSMYRLSLKTIQQVEALVSPLVGVGLHFSEKTQDIVQYEKQVTGWMDVLLKEGEILNNHSSDFKYAVDTLNAYMTFVIYEGEADGVKLFHRATYVNSTIQSLFTVAKEYKKQDEEEKLF